MSIGAPPTGTPQAMTSPGSLTSLLDGLVALQAALPTHPLMANQEYTLTPYRWQPNVADFPAIWNWLLPSTSEMRDLSRVRDSVNISTRIGISFADAEDRMPYVEACADAYRALVDVSFWNGSSPPPRTANPAYATWAIRTAMQTFSAEIGGVPCIGIEFIQNFWLDRRIA